MLSDMKTLETFYHVPISRSCSYIFHFKAFLYFYLDYCQAFLYSTLLTWIYLMAQQLSLFYNNIMLLDYKLTVCLVLCNFSSFHFLKNKVVTWSARLTYISYITLSDKGIPYKMSTPNKRPVFLGVCFIYLYRESSVPLFL